MCCRGSSTSYRWGGLYGVAAAVEAGEGYMHPHVRSTGLAGFITRPLNHVCAESSRSQLIMFARLSCPC